MFSGTIDSMSHEGGLLLSFGGSSPALDSIIVRASDGVYIGKIDGVLGNTESPMAHVGHIDRKLDLNSLVGEEVTIRAKKPREERYPSPRDRDSRDRRDGGRGNFDRDSRDRRGGDRRNGGRGNFDRGSRGRNDSNDGDWDCPKCNNSNFARRTECNRCGEPRSGGGGRRDGGRRDGGRGNFDRGSRDRRDGGRRDGGRGNFDRGSRDRRDSGSTFAHNDWDCSKCNNSNFSFRRECNRCGEPRSGGGGDRRDRGRGNFDRGSRDRRGGDRRDGGRGNFDRGSRGRNDSNDGDWDCPKCNNSNFARRTECNRCGEPRSGGGGRGRRDGGRGNFDRGSRDRRDGGRRDGGRGNFDRGSRDRRDGGRRDGDRGGRRDFSNRDETRTKPKENNFRKSKGKRAGHAHNNAPKPIVPRKFSRNSDD